MNFKKFINSDYLKSNPLCGIDTYKDTLNLVIGDCTRQINKLVLTGEELWNMYQNTYYITVSGYYRLYDVGHHLSVCSHFPIKQESTLPEMCYGLGGLIDGKAYTAWNGNIVFNPSPMISSLADWESYLAAQYAAGTPVTVWYVLAEPTTETITVPSGLSGTEEGYLNQSGTPTPTNPIYPTANTVEKWFDINHYIMGTSTDTITTLPAVLYPTGSTATVGLKGNTVQNGTPTPDNPIMPEGCGDLETVGAKAGQYKIPISSANSTTPVYLGVAESTRQIKKMVLTGEEAIEIKSGNAKWYIPIADMKTPTNTSVIEWYCSHYQAVANSASWTSYDYMISWSTADSGTSIGLRIRDIDFLTEVTVSDFKTYLQQQYAAGTPVTVWYVLANEETAVVNKPLMRIDNYADTVSGITIPTITGKDTVDVETTLKPSEVELTYTGWHEASVNEWDGSQWQ